MSFGQSYNVHLPYQGRYLMADIIKSSVKQHVNQLQNSTCRMIEREVAEKRINWFKQNIHVLQDKPSPRRAYELLFFEYMGLSPEDLLVVSESAEEIIWLSMNDCPTLEACKQLGLDTRQICRAAYEKSTQALLSQLDPQLRFLRSYEEIRPYADHCKEMIFRVDFGVMMDYAIEEANISRGKGNKGYGAVVTMGNRVIGKAHDTAITEKDPSLHAEMHAIREAVQSIGDANLSGAILFSTCEPCSMCFSLAVWANLTTIVYGASIQETALLGRSRINVSSREIVERSPVMIEIIGDVQGDACRSLYA
jgi:tRNA(Arg) A34 adenosine deaminase TadA